MPERADEEIEITPEMIEAGGSLRSVVLGVAETGRPLMRSRRPCSTSWKCKGVGVRSIWMLCYLQEQSRVSLGGHHEPRA